MEKTVVLFYPRPTRGYDTERRRDNHSVRRMYAPLSVMYLVSALEEAGFPVIMIDQRLMTPEEIATKIATVPEILFFGISSMTGSQIMNGLSFAQSVRTKYGTKIPIVWGGIHPSIYPLQTINHPLVDIIVRAEGEEAVVEIARALNNKTPLSAINGLCIKSDNGVNMTPPRCIINPLDSVPIPAWHHLKEFLNPAQYPILASINTSRGCPFHCAFCYKAGVEGRDEWRAFSVERVMKEVDYLHQQYGFDIFAAVDNNFIMKTDHAIKIIRQFKERKFKMSVVLSNFATLKDKIVNELPGFCDFVGYAPESGSPKIKKYLNKRADSEKMKLLNAQLRNIGLSTIHTFIFGFPFETDEDTAATVALCKDFKKINPSARMSIYQYMPYPEAPLSDLMVKDFGLVFPENFEQWSDADMYGELSLKFRPWVNEADLLFLNNFQLLFNVVFSSYNQLTNEDMAIYESDPRIRRLFGDITLIPRTIKADEENPLNDRLDATTLERFRDRIFI